MLLFGAKTSVKELRKFELACLKKKNPVERFGWKSTPDSTSLRTANRDGQMW